MARRAAITRRGQYGFTLIELMVALAVAAILASIAAPSFSTFVANQRVKAANQELYVTLAFARSEAIRRNGPVTVARCPDTDACAGWSAGWRVIEGTDETATDNTLRITPTTAVAGITITSTATEITFQRNGRAGDSATFTTCDSGARATQRGVSLDASGRPVTVPPGSQCT